jgi:DNA-binding MarR family transcriptional regulator
MDEDDLVGALERIAIGAVGVTTQALADAAPGGELTFPQWRALLVLGEAADGARIGEVANRVGGTIPATSRLLRRLERRGLIELATDDTDRRATRARLSEAGRRVRTRILACRQTALRRVATAIGDTRGITATAALETLALEFGRYA